MSYHFNAKTIALNAYQDALNAVSRQDEKERIQKRITEFKLGAENYETDLRSYFAHQRARGREMLENLDRAERRNSSPVESAEFSGEPENLGISGNASQRSEVMLGALVTIVFCLAVVI